MPRGLKTIVLVAIVAFAGYMLYMRLFGAMPGGPGMMGMGGEAPPVSVAVVEEKTVRPSQEFSGRLTAVDRAEIRAQVSGTLEKIHFTEGQYVEKGASLFTIDPRSYLANLRAAEARATLAATQFERAKSLLESKAVPQRDFDQRKNDMEVAKADLVRAKLDYEYTSVKAPISGRVSRAEVTVGNLVDAGGNAPLLTTIVSDKPIYADFSMDELTFLKYVQSVGSDAEKLKEIPVSLGLSNDTGTPYTGRVQSFDNELNTASGSIRVRAVFDNEDGKLLPGLFARVRISSPAEQTALLITDRAIGTDQNKKFVIVVHEDGKTERREISPGELVDGMRIVESGLKAGDKIIVNGLQRVMMPGQPVKPEMVPMEESSESRVQSSEKSPEQQTAESPAVEPATQPNPTENH